MRSIVFLWIVVLTVLAVSCVADRFPNLVTRLISSPSKLPSNYEELVKSENDMSKNDQSTTSPNNTPPLADNLNQKFSKSPSESFSYGTLTDIAEQKVGNPTSPSTPVPRGNFLSRQSRLFRKFVFKGFGVHFSKNPLDLKSCAFGVKVPITQNFPAYDSLIFLPRVNALLAVNYPLSFRVSVSISVPLQVLSMLILVMARQLYANSAQAAVGTSAATLKGGNIIWPTMRSSDSVTRVGLTLAYRYTKKLGHHHVIGPNIAYMPAIHMVRRILPLLIVFPALFLGVMIWAYQTFQAYVMESFTRSIQQKKWEEMRRRRYSQSIDDVAEEEEDESLLNTESSVYSGASPSASSHPKGAMSSPVSSSVSRRHKSVLVAEYSPENSHNVGSAAYASSTIAHLVPPEGYTFRPPAKDHGFPTNIVSSSVSTRPMTPIQQSQQTPFGDAYGIIEKWLLSKSPSFAAQAGYYDTNHVLAMGYSLYMELQPFFPFSRLNAWRKSRAMRPKVSPPQPTATHSTANATSSFLNLSDPGLRHKE